MALTLRRIHVSTRSVAAALIALTVVSYVLGAKRLIGVSKLAAVMILLIAFFKAWIVAQQFMDLRHANRLLNVIVSSWVVISCVIVVCLHLAA